jgi:methyl-accepting chemotaxis protein
LDRLWSGSVAGQLAALTEVTQTLSTRIDELAKRLDAVASSLANVIEHVKADSLLAAAAAGEPVESAPLETNDEAFRGLVDLASF